MVTDRETFQVSESFLRSQHKLRIITLATLLFLLGLWLFTSAQSSDGIELLDQYPPAIFVSSFVFIFIPWRILRRRIWNWLTMTHVDIGTDGIYIEYREGNYYLHRENLRSVNVWKTLSGAVHSLQVFSLERVPLLIVGFHSMDGLVETISHEYPEVPLNHRSLYIDWHNPYVPSLFVLVVTTALLLLGLVGGDRVTDIAIICGRFSLAFFFILALPFSRVNPRLPWLDIYLGLFILCRATYYLLMNLD